MTIGCKRGFVLFGFAACLVFASCSRKKVDFSAEVKPILNKHCISCHGGVKRNAKFSLLFRHEALDTAESGKRVIVPGDADHSELIRRITSNDPEVRMPYKEEALTNEEIDVLTRWVNEGAEWGDHWAYVAPKEVPIPDSKTLLSGFASDESAPWIKNPIDNFIVERLDQAKLKPAPEADKATLLRRLSMDITGLPPTVQEAQAYEKDSSPDAYEKVVDRLLASPAFGEKWATWWLDMARYSDTKGYEKDEGRSLWRYRDWVIKALNNDMPFDQFTTEQLAGDLLPNASDDQLIATAFHRNTMNNDEGGTDDEEFRVAALVDRVSTTWEIWQSTTMACVQCHTHPYDPFLNEEYYKFMAFWNNTRDEDTPGDHPNLRMYKEDDQKKLDAIVTWVKEQGDASRAQQVTKFLRTLEPKFHPHEFDQIENGSLLDNKFLGIRPGGNARLKAKKLDGKAYLVMSCWTSTPGGTMVIRADSKEGRVIANYKIEKGSGTVLVPLVPTVGTHDLYFFFYNNSIAPDWATSSIDWMAFLEDLPARESPLYPTMKKTFTELINAKVENTPIMVENTPEQRRTTNIFVRGSWLSKGDSVSPDVPASLNPFPKDAPLNRLGFSQWLLSDENPLTSRAIVNRFWEQIFGAGLVESLEDFGTQGAAPSHQALLDWLSLRFRDDYKWSMKRLVKEIVMSATYRQDSHIPPNLLEVDPANRLLARGARVRLSYEQIRDQALAVSGLLSRKMYGKSVMPYQPEGIWNSVYSDEHWKESEGEDGHRRSVYTYNKRTSPYPSMMMFDGSSREVCVSRRIRTNTPLQALVTLNDSSFVVASRHFASRMMKKTESPRKQIDEGYRMIMLRPMSDVKLDIFEKLYREALSKYEQDASASQQLTATDGTSPQLAAMTVVANAMLNLDEIITKE